jgi:hypothetical protein
LRHGHALGGFRKKRLPMGWVLLQAGMIVKAAWSYPQCNIPGKKWEKRRSLKTITIIEG